MIYSTVEGYLAALETHGATAGDIPVLIAKLQETFGALEQLVRLYGHYASLLNAHDGGQRRSFASAEEWLTRYREVERDIVRAESQ